MDLGVQLNIPMYNLQAIKENNAHRVSHNERCCQDMLIKWMNITKNPTWSILREAIKHSSPDKSTYVYICMQFIISIKFLTTWLLTLAEML